MFVAPTSEAGSRWTTSLASNSFHGSGFDLFLPNVFNSPGMSEVRQTCAYADVLCTTFEMLRWR